MATLRPCFDNPWSISESPKESDRGLRHGLNRGGGAGGMKQELGGIFRPCIPRNQLVRKSKTLVQMLKKCVFRYMENNLQRTRRKTIHSNCWMIVHDLQGNK